MSTVVAIEHVTLDGIFQGPARPDEDTRDGFENGGWAAAGSDPRMQEVIGSYMAGGWSLLAGRTTYEDLYGYWPAQPANPISAALDNVQKFVASRDPNYQLAWQNSRLLAGDAADAVAGLKRTHDTPLVIFGSGELVRSLMQRGLVDTFVLMIHPLVLGKGRRLFHDGSPLTTLKLDSTTTTGTGVLIATYRLAS